MHEGQIYIPRANSALLIGVLLLVAIFHTSDALASAYGVAVTTTMVVDGVWIHCYLEGVGLASMGCGDHDGTAHFG